MPFQLMEAEMLLLLPSKVIQKCNSFLVCKVLLLLSLSSSAQIPPTEHKRASVSPPLSTLLSSWSTDPVFGHLGSFEALLTNQSLWALKWFFFPVPLPDPLSTPPHLYLSG